ncbi:MAG: ribonuclease H-like domain-containing protein [Ignavibacteriales bacterium]|nr:ribonuclease H-like domain-containing protein [Ignavibacteriales bacterium]
MSRIVFDIETLGFPLESFDLESQTYLMRFADSEEKIEDLKKNLNLHALTAQVLCIALYNPDTQRGKVFFQSNTKEEYYNDDNTCHYSSGTEEEILKNFWTVIPKYDQFITFNGRSFDCPFLLLRSAKLGIQTSRNLMPYRYDADIHCDLLEQLTFYQATRRFSLDFYSKSFGITSPKAKGITGLDMKKLFDEKRFKDIAEYCYGDVLATAELYKRWHAYLNFR